LRDIDIGRRPLLRAHLSLRHLPELRHCW
jgi:hypothetical protein